MPPRACAHRRSSALTWLWSVPPGCSTRTTSTTSPASTLTTWATTTASPKTRPWCGYAPPRRHCTKTRGSRVRLPGTYEGEDEIDDEAAISRWSTVVTHPDELGWLREALRHRDETEDPDDELEPL